MKLPATVLLLLALLFLGVTVQPADATKKLHKCPAGFSCRKSYKGGGFFKKLFSRVEQVMCEAGTFSPKKNNYCMECTAGSFSSRGAGSCTLCPPGSFSHKGSATCQPCAKGFYSEEGASICRPCPSEPAVLKALREMLKGNRNKPAIDMCSK